MAKVYLSLGSNVGDKADFVTRALTKLEKHPRMSVLARSSLYETEPLEFPNQSWFVNAVCEVETDLPPMDLLDALLGIENEMEKDRTIPWGPRTIDLDILLYDEELVAEPRLVIPHIRMQDRAFVLIPLVEIAPEALHPLLGITAQDMFDQLGHVTAVRPLARESQA